ncbi:hypothetical protein BYT27DRAFT_6951503 [Phlegmacium glaucopus]|nr:hypothetical protein BYT27DRAFT_6951503 [Phlegmacium glaucopus]
MEMRWLCNGSPFLAHSVFKFLMKIAVTGVLSPKTSALTFVFGKRPFTFRNIHQAAASALTSTDAPKFDPLTPVSNERVRHLERVKGSLGVRTSGAVSQAAVGLVKELERRVEALDETIQAEESASQAPYYAEEELMAIYQDVLVVPVPQSELPNKAELEAIQQAEAEEDQRVLVSLEDRLCDPSADTRSQNPESKSTPHRILVRAHEIVSRVEATRNLALSTEEFANTTPNFLPISILSIRECQALVRASLKAKDGQAAELALEIMKRTGLPLPEGAVTNILKLYTFSGNSIAADELLTKFLKTPTDEQRHLHVLAHLNGTLLDTLPTSALELLHRYEGQNAPAPMQTYTSVITSLFSRPSSLARAQGLDIFAHMRYVAHPKPDVLLYTLMIRACASPVNTRYSSEPEKALDLWTEMTQDQKIQPTVGSYNAIILACARSGTKTYVNEALRLARQMLDSHRDAQGFPAFRPDRKTFCALLEGAKRIGDLGRARWILAEMVRGQGVKAKEEEEDTEKDEQVEIDEEVMMHMFHAYAAYRPPFQRAATKLLEEKPALQQQQQQPESQPTTTSPPIEAEDAPSFAHMPPQSHSEVIREVKVLFQRIVEDRNSTDSTSTPTPSLPFSERKFKSVDITTRLIASYLSIFYRHASLETSRALFWKIFEEHGVVRSLRAYVEALERCANARKGAERAVALKFADELWIKWLETEQAWKTTHNVKRSDPRLIERAHVAMVRLLAVSDETDRAMDHLKAFAAQYPPNDVRTPTPKTILRSTRTALVGSRPLVRMTSETEVPDDHVPPLLMFRDIEVLHHRLTDEGRIKDIGYVTWLCKAYEWALRVRRDAAVKAKVPQVEEKQVDSLN